MVFILDAASAIAYTSGNPRKGAITNLRNRTGKIVRASTESQLSVGTMNSRIAVARAIAISSKNARIRAITPTLYQTQLSQTDNSASDSIKYYKHALKLSRQQDAIELVSVLEGIDAPSQDASAKAWQEFSNALLNALCIHFPIENYEFTEREINHLAQYLTITELVISCLKNAYVSDREKIIEALLSPAPIEI